MSRVSLGKSLTSVCAFTYKHANFECLQSLMKISTFCLRFTFSYHRSCTKARVPMFCSLKAPEASIKEQTELHFSSFYSEEGRIISS